MQENDALIQDIVRYASCDLAEAYPRLSASRQLLVQQQVNKKKTFAEALRKATKAVEEKWSTRKSFIFKEPDELPDFDFTGFDVSYPVSELVSSTDFDNNDLVTGVTSMFGDLEVSTLTPSNDSKMCEIVVTNISDPGYDDVINVNQSVLNQIENDLMLKENHELIDCRLDDVNCRTLDYIIDFPSCRQKGDRNASIRYGHLELMDYLDTYRIMSMQSSISYVPETYPSLSPYTKRKELPKFNIVVSSIGTVFLIAFVDFEKSTVSHIITMPPSIQIQRQCLTFSISHPPFSLFYHWLPKDKPTTKDLQMTNVRDREEMLCVLRSIGWVRLACSMGEEWGMSRPIIDASKYSQNEFKNPFFYYNRELPIAPLGKTARVLITTDQHIVEFTHLLTTCNIIFIDFEYVEKKIAVASFLLNDVTYVLDFVVMEPNIVKNYVTIICQSIRKQHNLLFGYNLGTDLTLFTRFYNAVTNSQGSVTFHNCVDIADVAINEYRLDASPSLLGTVAACYGVKINKRHQKDNWSVRPLTDDQIQYVCDDVFWLAKLVTYFKNIVTTYRRSYNGK